MVEQSKLLNPGSEEAIKLGCTCPILDNCHGKGRYCNGEDFGWWISGDCEIHGKVNNDVAINGDMVK